MSAPLTRRAFAASAASLFLPFSPGVALGAPPPLAGLERSRVAGAFAGRLAESGHGADPPGALRALLARAPDDLAADASNGAEAIEARRLAGFAIRVLAPRALRDVGHEAAARAAETRTRLADAGRAVALARFDIGRRWGPGGRRMPRAAELAWGVCAHAGNAFHGAEHLRTHESCKPCAYHGCEEIVAWNASRALLKFLEEGQASGETAAWVWETGHQMVEQALNG